MKTQLRFIDMSNDAVNSDVVFFQRNKIIDIDEVAVAWKVIQNCGHGSIHPFGFPGEVHLNVEDSWGNYTPRLTASEGQRFKVFMSPSGVSLSFSGPIDHLEIQVANQLSEGSIRANIYKSGHLLAAKGCVAPEQLAIFAFAPVLYVGATSNVIQGQALDSAVTSDINTRLDLFGVASADIIMTGGGPGLKSQPYRFSLDNVRLDHML